MHKRPVASRLLPFVVRRRNWIASTTPVTGDHRFPMSTSDPSLNVVSAGSYDPALASASSTYDHLAILSRDLELLDSTRLRDYQLVEPIRHSLLRHRRQFFFFLIKKTIYNTIDFENPQGNRNPLENHRSFQCFTPTRSIVLTIRNYGLCNFSSLENDAGGAIP